MRAEKESREQPSCEIGMDVIPALEFCRLHPSHESGLVELFRELIERGEDRYFHPHPFSAEQAAKLVAYTGNDLYYIARMGDRVLAYGMLRGWDEGYRVPSLGIAVHPAGRGTGLARSFMLFLHTAAALRESPSIRLKVYPNNTAARRLYEKLGYQFQPTADEQLLGTLSLKGASNVA